MVVALATLAAVPVRADPLDALVWLAGCWTREGAEAGSVEAWLPPAGGSMLGMARSIRQGRMVEHEFLRLHVDAQGRVVYTASPSRQATTDFVATEVGEGTARFENLAHDFPQRIVYARDGDERLTVRIEGEHDGRTRGIDFRFRRSACGGPPPQR